MSLAIAHRRVAQMHVLIKWEDVATYVGTSVTAPIAFVLASDATFITLILTALGGTITTLAGLLWVERNKRGDVEREKAKTEVELAVANTKLASFGREAPDLVSEIALLKEELRRAIVERAFDDEQPRDRQQPWPYEDERRRQPPRR